jgi:hypothetical protein
LLIMLEDTTSVYKDERHAKDSIIKIWIHWIFLRIPPLFTGTARVPITGTIRLSIGSRVGAAITTMATSFRSTLKRPSHEIFDLWFFHKSTGPRHLVNTQKKYLRIPFRSCGGIRPQTVEKSTPRYAT